MSISKRGCFSLLALAILILPASIFMVPYYQYYPAIVAAPGYSLVVLTQPESYLEGASKRLRADLELGRPCKYSLIGWSEENVLLFEATCGATTRTEIWCWTPPDTLKQVKRVPSGLKAIREPVLEYVRVRDWFALEKNQPLHTTPPNVPEEDYRQLVVRLEGIISPNKRFVAFVAQHIYGPEDVIVIDLAGSEENEK